MLMVPKYIYFLVQIFSNGRVLVILGGMGYHFITLLVYTIKVLIQR